MAEQKLNLWQKMSNVMNDVKYLQKDDKVEFGQTKYKAISEEKVTIAVRSSLITNGIIIVPIEQEHTREDSIVTNKAGIQSVSRLATVNVKYKIINIENPEEYIIAVSSGTGVDTQDKAVGKAMTYAYKYMLLRTFAIPTGEDPDKVSSEELDKKLNPQVLPPKLPPKTPPKKEVTILKLPPKTPGINQTQQKQLFAIAGNDAKVVKDVLLKHNLTQTKEILTTEFESYCKEVEEAYKKSKGQK